MSSHAWLLVAAGASLLSGSGFLAYSVLSRKDNFVRRLFRRYAARLDRHASFLQMERDGTAIARIQACVCSALLVSALAVRSWIPATFVLLAGALPMAFMRKKHRERVTELEGQLDTWLLMLANALKATPSVGEAIASTVALVPRPFSDEVDLLVKELRLGAPLDRALRASARRINSTSIASAFSTIVVARKTGGDLPSTLERASAALREAARLEGVLRSKTAEGRGQVLVLASIPFVLCIMIAWLDRSWFDPMLNHPMGRGILLACALAWLIATLWAHQIAKADL